MEDQPITPTQPISPTSAQAPSSNQDSTNSQTPPPSLNNSSKKKFKIILIGFFVLFFLTIGSAAAIYTFKEVDRKNNNDKKSTPPTETQNSPTISQLKTYQGNEFLFNYNPNWSVENETNGDVIFTKIIREKDTTGNPEPIPQISAVYLQVLPNPSNLSAEKWISEMFKKDFEDLNPEITPRVISGIETARTITPGQVGGQMTVFTKNNNVYILGQHYTWTADDETAYTEFVNEAISTFKLSTNSTVNECVVGGCSGQFCISKTEAEGFVSTCEYSEQYACYETAECKIQPSGECGWTQTSELMSCLKSAQ